MIKLGVVSDLHIEFWESSESIKLIGKINAAMCDIVVNAGDIHPDPTVRDAFHHWIKVPYAHVLGNHDFYGKQQLQRSRFIVHKNGLKIVGATLWTDFKKHDPWVMMQFPQALADGTQILINDVANYHTLADEIYDTHKADLEFIANEKPDVVVTHHAPSFKSVHPMFYRSGNMNYYFFSDLDNFILDNPNIKLWIHGHTHNPVDYMIGNTRVLANQLGYPSERFKRVDNYNVQVVEV